MDANQMSTEWHGAHVQDTELATPVRFVGRPQLVSSQRAFAVISVHWSWVGLHTLACEVSQPTTCGREPAHIENHTHTHTHTHTQREREREREQMRVGNEINMAALTSVCCVGVLALRPAPDLSSAMILVLSLMRSSIPSCKPNAMKSSSHSAVVAALYWARVLGGCMALRMLVS